MHGRFPKVTVFVLGWLAVSLAWAAEDVVRLGATMSQTGKYADFGSEGLLGLKMFIEDLNMRGGASGRPVELVVYDDESDRDIAARLYEKLIQEDQVDFLVGPYGTPLTLAAAAVAERYGYPLVVTGTALEIFEGGMKNVFGVYTPAPEIMRPVLDIAKEKGLRRVALVYADNEAPTNIAESVKSQLAAYGAELVFEESYDRNFAKASEFRTLVARITAARPEVVICGSYLEDSVALLKELKAQQFAPDVLVFSYGSALEEFGSSVGPDNAEGVLATSQWLRAERMPGAYDFAFRFKLKHGHFPSYPAVGAYASGQVIEAAARLAAVAGKGRDEAAIRDQLRTMSFTSLLGPYEVDGTGRQVAKPIYLLQWQKGQRHLIFPAKFADVPLVYPFPSWVSR
jgi:branched-chain amino acid transport system substrate-binding protein